MIREIIIIVAVERRLDRLESTPGSDYRFPHPARCIHHPLYYQLSFPEGTPKGGGVETGTSAAATGDVVDSKERMGAAVEKLDKFRIRANL